MKGELFGIFVATLLKAEEDGHRLLDGEGYTQLRNMMRMNHSLWLRGLVDTTDPSDYDKIEHQLYPKGSSVLNVTGLRVHDNYDVGYALADWDKRIREMP